MKVKIKITLEDDNGNINEKEIEFDNGEFSEEIGYKAQYDQIGLVTDLVPNGHRRFSVKAWSGCDKYEDFVGKE